MFANAKHRKRARQVLALGEIAAVSSHKVLMDLFPEVIRAGRVRDVELFLYCSGCGLSDVSG